MNFILTAGWDDGIADLTERLVRELVDGNKVLWLTSGGSNILATTQIMSNIPSELTQNLTILLADERFGPVGHAESNWAQLLDSGLDTQHARILTVLQDDSNVHQTTLRYENMFDKAAQEADVTIAQLGIGPDGHIAGILIDSPATKANGHSVVSFVSHEKPPRTRMTLTFDALRRIDVAYCFAFGKPKRVALKRLQQELPYSEQPAQILRVIPEVYIYNDQIGHHA